MIFDIDFYQIYIKYNSLESEIKMALINFIIALKEFKALGLSEHPGPKMSRCIYLLLRILLVSH